MLYLDEGSCNVSYNYVHWFQLVHREAERKISSLKQELEALRRSYVNLEADYQAGEASYHELQAQMERRERKFYYFISVKIKTRRL